MLSVTSRCIRASRCVQSVVQDLDENLAPYKLAGGTLTATASGKTVNITDESGGTSKVTIADVNQSNGVIHVVDKVLLPK